MPVVLDALYDNDLAVTLACWRDSSTARVIMVVQSEGWRYVFLYLANKQQHKVERAVTGELGALTKELLLTWVKRGARFATDLEWAQSERPPIVGTDIIDFAEPFVFDASPKATKLAIEKFVKFREKLLSDPKRPGLPESVINWVYARSSGICEFEGCSQQLFKDDRLNYGYYGYLAHIVAAKAKGPRGDERLSPALADSPSNLMLCCDVHHRLIDKVDPDSYNTTTLTKMVQSREAWRHNQIETLSYPLVHAFAFIGDIAGRTTTFPHHDARKALLSAKLMPANERVVEYALRDTQGGNDVNDPGYWASFLRAFRGQILQIYTAIRGDGAFGVNAHELAIFPLGNMPAMLLGGWLVSEARRVHLFHFRRNDGTWVRPMAAIPDQASFKWTGPDAVDSVGQKILITLELTATISDEALTEELKAMPRVRIMAVDPHIDVVGTDEAMARYRNTCHEAWAYVVDTLKASEVSICAIAPAAAVFAFGMKLQSRLHPRIDMYQMVPNEPPFIALRFDRHTIVAPAEVPNRPLQLDAY